MEKVSCDYLAVIFASKRSVLFDFVLYPRYQIFAIRHSRQQICCGSIMIGPNGEVAVDSRYLLRCEACMKLKEPAIPSTVTSAAHTIGFKPIRFTEAMVSKSLLREFNDVVSMDITAHTAEDESAEEECDSLGEDQSASSLCSSQSEDGIRAAKLAFDVESEVTGNSEGMMNSPDFGVDPDEGFFDKQLGSPTSTSSRASTPPPPVPHMMSHPSSGLHQHQSPPLIRGGTT